jgi:aminocarboxymuconate-semialdehyde decarboxylase
MLGSDYPFDMGDVDPVGTVGQAGLDAATCALIEGGTAAGFLGIA